VLVGGSNALQPSVILTLNYGGTGKALVTGAPIVFAFTRGGGLLTAVANTNDYGQANCVVARLDNTNEQSVIRASLLYRVKGFSFLFEGVNKDFVYMPPSRNAAILVLEKAGELVAEDPVILNAVYLSDGYSVSQVELAGKKYNIFKSVDQHHHAADPRR